MFSVGDAKFISIEIDKTSYCFYQNNNYLIFLNASEDQLKPEIISLQLLKVCKKINLLILLKEEKNIWCTVSHPAHIIIQFDPFSVIKVYPNAPRPPAGRRPAGTEVAEGHRSGRGSVF